MTSEHGFIVKTPEALNTEELARRTEFEARMIEKARITDFPLIDAIRAVDRIDFVPETARHLAYADKPLPLLSPPFEDLASISQPSLTIEMIQYLHLNQGDNVLEIGTGSGYSAALMSHLAGHVTSIEIIPPLSRAAKKRLDDYNIPNVDCVVGDGAMGYVRNGPYDKVVFTAAIKEFPLGVLDQMLDGAVIIAPIGEDYKKLTLTLGRIKGGEIETVKLSTVGFVPLVTESREVGWGQDAVIPLPDEVENDELPDISLEEMAEKLGMDVPSYVHFIAKAFGFRDDAPFEKKIIFVEGIGSWIQVLTADLDRELMIE